MAAISIVLKAVDQYSNTIQGLNQGFELVGKTVDFIVTGIKLAFEGVKWAAESAMAGISKAVELASKGGEIAEMQSQFKNLADYHGVDSKRIIENLKEIAQNTMSTTEAIALSAKGVAANLNEKELDTIFTFVKRRTESTGESFEEMSQKIIRAFSKDKFKSLSEFVPEIDKDDKKFSSLEKIAKATEGFGEAAWNTKDKVEALTNKYNEFFEKIGEGINDSEEWQKFFDELEKTVVDFVKNFDPKPITDFFNIIGTAIGEFIKVIESTGIPKAIREEVEEAQRWLKLFVIGVEETFNNTYEAISAFAQFQRENPLFSQKILGLNPEMWSQVEISLAKMGHAINRTQKEVKDETIKWTKQIEEETTKQLEAFNQNSLKMAESYAKRLQDVYDAIDASVTGEAEDTFPIASTDQLIDGLDKDLDDLDKHIKLQEDIARKGSLVEEASRPVSDKAADVLTQANWPAEFQALGDFMFKWVLSVAAGSPIPMAVVTTP